MLISLQWQIKSDMKFSMNIRKWSALVYTWSEQWSARRCCHDWLLLMNTDTKAGQPMDSGGDHVHQPRNGIKNWNPTRSPVSWNRSLAMHLHSIHCIIRLPRLMVGRRLSLASSSSPLLSPLCNRSSPVADHTYASPGLAWLTCHARAIILCASKENNVWLQQKL